ncbi:MAG: DNA primase [Alphaproteobacteria bacterium]|nr:DNA primase [Alphaproteobacteria bacterium]
MAITPAFLDELRDKVPLSDLIGRKVKLTHKGKEHTGLCPFHKEKTPSFTVNDDKGFYHCFGCGAHGDQIKYLMESEKMPFIEAVEYLANMAGVKMPDPDPKAAERSERNSVLLRLMECACRYFQTHLFGTAGVDAKQYLIRRGMSSDLAKRFRLGYAPTGSGLLAHLTANKFSIKDMQAMGLVAPNRDGNGYHDYFYDRVIFPVMNRRGQVIGFSGRILHEGEPKYLNSPETDLFHKGDLLYGLPQAIDTVRKKNTALVVEGNVDVISLHGAGFTQAMAPLGTAFTEDQIRLLWTLCDEPVICFDGDGAGRKAMVRALNRALPMLRAGKSLKFAYLPDGMDPDDMIRKKSAKALQEEIEGAKPFIWSLWQMLLDGRTLDTPERLAKLEKDAEDTVNKIVDERVRSYYKKEIQKRLKALGKKGHSNSVTSTSLLSPSDSPQLLAYIVCYPQICMDFSEEIMQYFRFSNEVLQQAFDTIMAELQEKSEVSTEDLWQLLSSAQQELLQSSVQHVKKKQADEEVIVHDIQQLILAAKKRTLMLEIERKNEEYLRTENPKLKAELMALQAEMTKLKENE